MICSPINQILNINTLKKAVIILTLVFMGISISHTKHKIRILNSKIDSNNNLTYDLERQYQDILLEKATWGSMERVEKIAKNNLNMLRPRNTKLIVIK